MSQALIEAIRTKLASDTGPNSFHAAVGGRYYHLESKDGAQPPLCIYAVSDPAPLDLGFNGQEYEVWRFTFVAYVSSTASANPDVEAATIDSKLRALLHKATLTATGYVGVKAICERNGSVAIDGNSVQVESVYRVFGAREL